MWIVKGNINSHHTKIQREPNLIKIIRKIEASFFGVLIFCPNPPCFRKYNLWCGIKVIGETKREKGGLSVNQINYPLSKKLNLFSIRKW